MRLAAVLLGVAVLTGCEREERALRLPAHLSDVPTTPPTGSPFEGNAWATAEGKQLFVWMNCAGCHAKGGGGMGPPLMDSGWRYGSDPASVYTSIVDGRPNGMPSFKDRLSEEQVWKLVEYVRSIPALTPAPQRPGRSDAIHAKDPEYQYPRQPPVEETP
jgi:cytochrome c oxidase cbb3-type subunit 3